jgi:hypothetical protein
MAAGEGVLSAEGALLADRFASAADLAAREAERACGHVQRPGRARNLARPFKAAVRAGAGRTRRYEQIVQDDRRDVAMAGIADTAKYTLAAANAARYAAEAAAASGSRWAARRTRRAALNATYWASQAQYAADHLNYAPFTALETARAARAAATAARRAAVVSGPLSRGSVRAVSLAVAVLPSGSRARYQEEWKSDMCCQPRESRRGYTFSMLAAAMRLAVVLRTSGATTRSTR